MPAPGPVALNVGGEQLVLTEDNCMVCLFTEAAEYNHLYIQEADTDPNLEPTSSAIFATQDVLNLLVERGFPTQTRRLPLAWDKSAYQDYLSSVRDEFDRDIDELMKDT